MNGMADRARDPRANHAGSPEPAGETGPHDPSVTTTGKDPAAVSLGRRGGLKGGKARAAALTPEQRSEIARKAAAARWRKPGA